ncbi:hypothetical protein PMAYCL1PPCAC_16865, partial [Pristionchus mayeri]
FYSSSPSWLFFWQFPARTQRTALNLPLPRSPSPPRLPKRADESAVAAQPASRCRMTEMTWNPSTSRSVKPVPALATLIPVLPLLADPDPLLLLLQEDPVLLPPPADPDRLFLLSLHPRKAERKPRRPLANVCPDSNNCISNKTQLQYCN